ncbi:PEP-CTERM sorting domain-containing protein [Lacipirellula sp.]|uniref:PEP-CTERM sorting domain-containing protein n=1 Tax=Lacipirellula sp. TaxID=2691419 RepID=UPI003D0C05FA
MKTTFKRLFFGCLLAVLPGGAAHAQATFNFSGGTTFTGVTDTIPIRANSPGGNSIGTISAIVFDPTSQVGGEYNRIYFTNREQTTGTAVGGLYVTDRITETVTLIGLQSGTANTNTNPSSLAIDSTGTVYLGRDVSPQLWRVNSPLASPTFTQMLGNYGTATTDDDPISISWVPSTNQVMVFDQGLDTDPPVAVSLVNAGSTSASPSYTTIWTATPAVDNNIRGMFSTFDNYGYLTYAALPLESGLAAIYRVDLAGNLQTFLLSGITSSLTLDDSIAVNPLDGSVWLPINTGGTDRTYYRVDVAKAALQSPGVYLASTTAEFTATGLNGGQNSVAFSPDGKWLGIAVPDGADTIYLLQTKAAVPEPATLGLAGVALLGCVAARRRK